MHGVKNNISNNHWDSVVSFCGNGVAQLVRAPYIGWQGGWCRGFESRDVQSVAKVQFICDLLNVKLLNVINRKHETENSAMCARKQNDFKTACNFLEVVLYVICVKI